MDVVAVIPAYNGSKDLAGKSGRLFAGRPLISHSIEQAHSADHVNRVIVATDEAEIAKVAGQFGADSVGSPAVSDTGGCLAHALRELEKNGGTTPDMVVALDPTCPLRTPTMIDEAIDRMIGRNSDSLLSVHRLSAALWSEDENGLAHPVDQGSAAAGTPRYLENNSIVVTKATVLRDTGKPLGGRTALYEIPSSRALTLKTESDWRIGEALYQRLWPEAAAARLRGIRLLALDFDGVMTDNRVIVLQDGREAVLCNRGDGMGLDLVRAAGFSVAVISKEGNPVVTARCTKLKIPCIQGVGDKLPVLTQMVEEQGLTLDAVAFMGNDVNDIECMRAVGVAIAPADSHPAAIRAADMVTVAAGGIHAVREVTDLLIANRENATGD